LDLQIRFKVCTCAYAHAHPEAPLPLEIPSHVLPPVETPEATALPHEAPSHVRPCQVRRLGGGVYVVQASWSMEDHGSVRRVSLGGR
jgi:hypothetical protein